MKHLSIGLAACLAAAATPPLAAGEHQDALAICLTQSTSHHEKNALVRWIFVAMSAHPLTDDLGTVPAEKRAQVTREAGQVFATLITETCGRESAATIHHEGTDAFGKSFEVLGMAAMDGLMSHPEVEAAVSELTNHIDPAKFEEMMRRHTR